MKIKIAEFEQYQEYKGTFVKGCVERGDGSSFRAKAHAHCDKDDPYFGWICVRSPKRVFMKDKFPLKPSMLMIHELAHILSVSGHNDKWRKTIKELGGRVEERYTKAHYKKKGYGHRHKWEFLRKQDNQNLYHCKGCNRILYTTEEL